MFYTYAGRATMQKIRHILKMTGRYTAFTLYALLIAASYGYTAFIGIYPLIEAGLIFEAYLVNLVMMVFMLIFYKLIAKLLFLRKVLSKNTFTKILRAVIVPKIAFMSFKAGLYLFNIFVLIASKVIQLNPYAYHLDGFALYLVSMEYSLILLMSIDIFIKQIGADSRKIAEIDAAEKEAGKEAKAAKKTDATKILPGKEPSGRKNMRRRGRR